MFQISSFSQKSRIIATIELKLLFLSTEVVYAKLNSNYIAEKIINSDIISLKICKMVNKKRIFHRGNQRQP